MVLSNVPRLVHRLGMRHPDFTITLKLRRECNCPFGLVELLPRPKAPSIGLAAQSTGLQRIFNNQDIIMRKYKKSMSNAIVLYRIHQRTAQVEYPTSTTRKAPTS